MRNHYLSLLFIFVYTISFGQEFTDLKGDYLGQSQPGETPAIFAPGIISVDSTVEHGYPAFSPDGNEVYWQSNLRHKDKDTETFLKTMRRIGGKWTIAKTSQYGMPAFSPNGNKLFFVYPNRAQDREFYFIEKQGENWTEPQSLNLISRFPELKYMFGLSVTNDETLYFCSNAEDLGSMNNIGIYRSELIDGTYSKPELLPVSINKADGVLNWLPFIAPDESYLLFSSNRSNNQQDIFISFRQSDGTWTKAYSLGEAVNTPSGERYPYVSPDGNYLFFTRWITDYNEDVMWVSSEIIEGLREKSKAK